MTLSTSNCFTQNSIPSLDVGDLKPLNDPPKLDLVLPEPIEIKHNGFKLYAWDLEGYATILQIFNGYSLWADNYIAESERDAIWEIRLEICQNKTTLERRNYELIRDNRDVMYDLWKDEIRDYKKQEIKNRIKIILISSGVGIIGIATGLVIGFIGAQ